VHLPIWSICSSHETLDATPYKTLDADATLDIDATSNATSGVDTSDTTSHNLVIVCLYMDDLLITGDHEGEIKVIKRKLMNKFETTNLEKLTYFLGFEFTRVKGRNGDAPKEVCDEGAQEI